MKSERTNLHQIINRFGGFVKARKGCSWWYWCADAISKTKHMVLVGGVDDGHWRSADGLARTGMNDGVGCWWVEC